MIRSDEILETDHNLMPTGKFVPLVGSLFELNEHKPIGYFFQNSANGLDHFYKISKNCIGKCSAILKHLESGRTLEITTNSAGYQVYSGQYLTNDVMKNSRRTLPQSGVCLESHDLPYSLNLKNNQIILLPGEVYNRQTIWKFS
jgi:aldose 1-epimerase